MILDLFINIRLKGMWSKIKYRWIKLLCLVAIPNETLQFESFHHACNMYFLKYKSKISPRNWEMSMNMIRVLKLMHQNESKDKILSFLMSNPNTAMKSWLTAFIKK